MVTTPDTTVPEPIPDDLEGEILQDIADLEAKLALYTRSLTDAERRALPKMGTDSVEFVQNGENALYYSLSYMPRDFDDKRFHDAFALARQLGPISLRLESLARGTDDAEMLFGSIAYSDALEIYGQLGSASQKDSALLPFYDTMKARFAKLRGKRDKPTP